jgi:hypothetical protein
MSTTADKLNYALLKQLWRMCVLHVLTVSITTAWLITNHCTMFCLFMLCRMVLLYGIIASTE